MKTEFENLKKELLEGSTFDKNRNCNANKVLSLLESLEAKIDEVNIRMECARRCDMEAMVVLDKYLDKFESSDRTIILPLDEHDIIMRGVRDSSIALDLSEDMCIVDNWYNLFKKKPYITFVSSHGTISCDESGDVLSVEDNFKIEGEDNYLFEIERFDIDEFKNLLDTHEIELSDSADISMVSFINKDNSYNKRDEHWISDNFLKKDDNLVNAKKRLDLLKGEMGVITNVDIDGCSIVLTFANGMNIKLAQSEIDYQAHEYVQNK
jgi:hypothetical protein